MSDVPGLEAGLRASGFCGTFESDAAARVVYGTDNSVYQLRPVAAVVPTSTDDLVAVALANAALDEPIPLVARGGGTGTNGQSLTNGLVVDTRREMNRIISIDVDAREAVVQPGVVLGQLDAALRPHGLFFAPHVSTASRATIGGMVATDAAGKGSLVHGRTNDHLLEVEAVLADGTAHRFTHVAPSELERILERTDRIGGLYRSLVPATAGLAADAFPDLPRGFTGYNLSGAGARPGLDVTKLLAGSEGTLALIGEVRIRLTELPRDPWLAVVAYRTFDEAVRESNRLKATRPIAIECLDDRTISLATGSPAFPTLARLLGPASQRDGVSLLLMEYDGTDGLDQLHDLVGGTTTSLAMTVTSDPDEIAAVWKVRADAVGLLGQSVDGRRSVAFVEDCAVPPHRLEEFVSAFRALLDAHGLSYGMFGHADVGCVHVRPALDLYDEHHERLLRTVSDEVAGVVARFGGVLWGEHGRGFRGEFLDLDAGTIERMRAVKTAFDPLDVMNPHKLYAPAGAIAPITRIDEVPLRVHADRAVPVVDRQTFDGAFACNGNGVCHHWGAPEVMCPSFKVTLDPRLSPKGRADLLRGWLADPTDDELADAVASSMHQCLSCGACTGRCPVQVDIPEMKSLFFEQRPEQGRRARVRNAALSRFESMLPAVQRAGSVIRRAQRRGAPLLERVLGLCDLPELAERSSSHQLDALGAPLVRDAGEVADATVVILPDAFTSFLDTPVLTATIEVLRIIGESPAIGPFEPSGKFDHVKGRRARFAATVARQREMIERFATHEVPLVVIEPAVSLLAGHEYSAIDATFPADRIESLAAFLATRIDALPTPVTCRGVVQLFGHCTEVSLAPDHMTSYRSMLEAVGFEVVVEHTTCCGMAGVFGHEVEHRPMSMQLFDVGWRPRLESVGPDHRCVSGFSCRSQAARAGHQMVHPIQLVAATLA